MEPFTLAMMGLGMGLQAFGQYQQSKAQAEALEYNRRVAEIRAQQAMKDALFRADIEANKALRVRGKQEAIVGKTGTMMGGSILDILSDQAFTDEMNQLAIKYSGETAAYNQRTQAALYGSQADTQREAGMLRSISTLAGGAGQMYGQWKKGDIAKQLPSPYAGGYGYNPYDYYGD